MFVTLYLSFNIPLSNPHAFNALVVQVQISGAPQVATLFMATIHHQMTYRIQNHSFDIPVSKFSQIEDVLFLKVDVNKVPQCTYVPRQLTNEQL